MAQQYQPVNVVLVQQGGIDPLQGVTSIRVGQKIDWGEYFSPCCGEQANQYSLSVSDPTGESTIMPLGVIIEQEQTYTKFLCQGQRPLQMEMWANHGKVLFTSQRDYRISAALCIPCCRPETIVKQDGNVLGFVKQPYLFCGRTECRGICMMEEMDICDEQGNMIYYVSGQTCQCGVMMRCRGMIRCCGPCQFITLDICLPNKEIVGKITNIYNGCFTELCTKADKFVITFPPKANQRDKILLINAVIAIDYDLFESSCNNK